MSNWRIKKIDRYLIRKFLATFFFTCLLFSVIALVIEISQKLENLLKTEIPFGRIFVEYLLHFIPFINGVLWPLFALIAVVFFTSRLARDTEFIAMLGAGVSLRRLAIPYIISAVFIMILHLMANHYLIPMSNDQRLTFEYAYVRPDRVESRNQDVHFFLNPDQKVYIRFYSRVDTSCRDIRIETFDKSGRLSEILKARTMRMISYPNKWRINDYEIRTLESGRESYEVFTGQHMDTIINLVPEDFVTLGKDIQMMTSPQLRRHIERELSKGVGRSSRILSEYYRRTAEAFSILILTIIGFSVASRKVRGGVGLHLALGIATGALFVFVGKFSITYALSPGANPLVAIWMPNLIFGLIAVVLFYRAQK
jgi:lipopolysaccharide export system permease protein